MVVLEGDIDTAGDEEVEGRDGEAVADVILDTDATDLAWDSDDPYLQVDYEISGVHQAPVAALTPLSMPTKETPHITKHQETPEGDPSP